jgi:hypothetical protein
MKRGHQLTPCDCGTNRAPVPDVNTRRLRFIKKRAAHEILGATWWPAMSLECAVYFVNPPT